MITENASDLISEGLALADLTNTTFPTSLENRIAINRAYSKLYEEAINIGEKYWLESIEITESTELPSDFFQVYEVIDTETQETVRRYQKGTNNKVKYYDIVGNNIILNRCNNTIQLYYYPTPIYLDPSSTGDVEIEFPNNISKQLCVDYIAEYYAIKQQADINGIELLIENDWSQYQNMLRRDLNDNLKIQDIRHNIREHMIY